MSGKFKIKSNFIFYKKKSLDNKLGVYIKMKLINLNIIKRKRYQFLKLLKKIQLSKDIINYAYDNFGRKNLALAWTGGKDSTLMLWLTKLVAEKRNEKMPKVLFIDEGDVFPEILSFTKKIIRQWKLDFIKIHNKNVSSKAKKIGDIIKVKDLNEFNKKELKKLGFKAKKFVYEPESLIGNHLMKTAIMNLWLEQNKTKALLVGVRWDEQPARAEDDFLRKIKDPCHFRLEPILHFTEKDVWKVIKKFKIPYPKLYDQGYRSLGAKSSTTKTSSIPASKQNLKKTKERAGRKQDKEAIMARLRALGYM